MLSWFGKKSKVGLGLGSGAARGLAHIGVVKALLEHKVRIDMVCGSSMGALVGACLAAHGDVKELEQATLEMDFRNLLRLADPNIFLLFKGFVSGNKVEDFLRLIIGDIDFKDLKIPFWVVATDIRTGDEVIISQGSVVKAVRASISMPAVFTPFNYLDKTLIDGGIVNPLPVDILEKQGAKFIIASNVILRAPVARKTSSPPQLKPHESQLNDKIKSMGTNISDIVMGMRKMFLSDHDPQKRELPSMFETVVGAIYTMEHQMMRSKAKHADLMIRPHVEHIGALEFYRAKEAIDIGYKKAIDRLQDIPRKYLH